MDGTGTVTFGVNNAAYTGSLTVNSGTLVAAGSQSTGSGELSIETSARLVDEVRGGEDHPDHGRTGSFDASTSRGPPAAGSGPAAVIGTAARSTTPASST